MIMFLFFYICNILEFTNGLKLEASVKISEYVDFRSVCFLVSINFTVTIFAKIDYLIDNDMCVGRRGSCVISWNLHICTEPPFGSWPVAIHRIDYVHVSYFFIRRPTV